MELILQYMGIAGSFVLAISGALTAMKKRFDGFGVLIIAFVTAVGGGTLRDILLTEKSVFWIEDPIYIYFVIGGALAAVVFRHQITRIKKPLLFFDAIGLGLYAITGAQIGVAHELSAINCIIFSVLTGAFGGVIRDILVNEIPVIFKREIYATVGIVGAALYLCLHHYEVAKPYLQLIPVSVMIILRLIVIHYQLTLPSIYHTTKTSE